MTCCTATANLTDDLTLRCDRTAGHEQLLARAPESGEAYPLGAHPDHYDFHQDAFWSVLDLDDGAVEIQCDFQRREDSL